MQKCGIGGLMSSTEKHTLIESATCTALFAIVFGLIVSCGGGRSLLNLITHASSSGVRILSRLSPTTASIPQSGTQAPLIAAMAFQSSQQTSTIQQSFQGLSCDAFIPGTKVNWNGSSTGFIPILVLGDPWIIGDPNPNAQGVLTSILFAMVCSLRLAEAQAFFPQWAPVVPPVLAAAR